MDRRTVGTKTPGRGTERFMLEGWPFVDMVDCGGATVFGLIYYQKTAIWWAYVIRIILYYRII